jgi:hypothetical protein
MISVSSSWSRCDSVRPSSRHLNTARVNTHDQPMRLADVRMRVVGPVSVAGRNSGLAGGSAKHWRQRSGAGWDVGVLGCWVRGCVGVGVSAFVKGRQDRIFNLVMAGPKD